MATDNLLYYGDNLDVLRRHIKDETVDLIYLDPLFNSNANYNVLFKEKSGEKSAAQIQAFGDTWHWDQVAAKTYQELVEAGGKVSEALQAFRMLVGGLAFNVLSSGGISTNDMNQNSVIHINYRPDIAVFSFLG
jgi:site-specific DNA-methyltransferase (adenine-specific)